MEKKKPYPNARHVLHAYALSTRTTQRRAKISQCSPGLVHTGEKNRRSGGEAMGGVQDKYKHFVPLGYGNKAFIGRG